jgi:uracil-DNA glycosylase
MAGHEDLDVTDPRALAATLDATARVQSVKCSARDNARSQRTKPMRENCPPRYLRRELAVLRPGLLVCFGQPSWDSIEAIATIDESVGGEDFSRSTVQLENLTFEMVWLHHPSYLYEPWERSYQLLLGNLRARPMSKTPAP